MNSGGVYMIGVKIEYNNNIKEVLKAEEQKKEKILYAIGLKWQSICSKIITQRKIVDTGRLRASLTFITVNKVGSPINTVTENKTSDFLSGTSGDENTLIVGSNVEYARKQEFENKKGAFLRPSVLEYKNDYKEIAEQIWKE